jgi:hypothetical protein
MQKETIKIVVQKHERTGNIVKHVLFGDTSLDDIAALHGFDKSKPYAFVTKEEAQKICKEYLPAWYVDDNGKLQLDIDKAREIRIDKLRAERLPLFQELDVMFMRALESGDVHLQQDIIKRKVALRDVTKSPRIFSLESLSDFKSITINDLLD